MQRILPLLITIGGPAKRAWAAARAVIQTVTGGKRAVVALRESEARFRSIFENSAVGTGILALDGRFLEVNRAWYHILGYSPEEILSKTFMDITHPEDRERSEAAARSLVAGETSAVTFEKRYLRKDGHVVWAILSASVVRDSQGNPLYFVSQIQDITERKQAEEALYRLREELEGKVERQLRRRNPYRLTFREMTVLHLIAAGESARQIALTLGISPFTAEKHVSNILEKMGAASRTEASVRALREGLLE